AKIHERIGRRGIAAAIVLTAVLLVAVATPQLLGRRVAAALATLGAADAKWLWLAGVGFALSVLGAAGSWRCAIGICGGRVGLGDSCARYGAGSLVNTFVPARGGDLVRIALFSRALPSTGRVWTTGGAFAALGAARALVLGALVVGGAVAGVVPLWPLLVVAGIVAVGVAAGVVARRSSAHLLDAFRRLGRDPVTPGNIGVTSAAIAAALHAHGTSFTDGLAAGIAFHAVETAVGLMVGIASLVWLAPYPTPNARRVALLAGAASWALGLAGAFSATVLVPLV